MDDAALERAIRGAQRGDPASMDALVEQFAPRIFGFLYRLTFSREDAEDLMQEVFVRVARTLRAYQHDGRFEPWIFRIAGNLARDRIRRQRRGPRIVRMTAAAGSDDALSEGGAVEEVESPEAQPDARLRRREDVDALNAALARLPEAEREVIMLRHFSEMSFREIADATGVPLGTALARGHRGLKRLRDLMRGEGCEAPNGADAPEMSLAE